MKEHASYTLQERTLVFNTHVLAKSRDKDRITNVRLTQMLHWLLFCSVLGMAIGTSAFTLFSQSIRLDEAQSIWFATKPVPTIIALVATDVHVPLYHLLLHIWMQVFGTSIAHVRVLSFIFYLLTLPVLYKLAKEASSSKVAALTVIFFALSPFIVWYSTEARMYTLFTFITCLNHLYFLRFIRSGGTKYQFSYFLTALLGFFSHYFFSLVILTQGMYLLWQAFLQTRQATSEGETLRAAILRSKRILLRYVFLTSTAVLSFLPWLLYVYNHGLAAYMQPMIPKPTTYNIFQTYVNFLFGFQTQGIVALLVSLWPLSVMILFFVFTQRKRLTVSSGDYFLLATFLPVFLVFIVSFVRPIFLSRYLILVTPTLFFLLAWLLLNYSRRISGYLIAAVTTVMFGLLFYQNVSAATPVKEDYSGVADYLAHKATAKDVIGVTAPFTIYPIEYSYTGQAKIVTIPPWNRYIAGPIPAFSELNLLRQIADYKKVYQNIYVVFSYDQGYEQKIKAYMDTHYAIVDRKQFSPGLEMRAYKLRYDIQ